MIEQPEPYDQLVINHMKPFFQQLLNTFGDSSIEFELFVSMLINCNIPRDQVIPVMHECVKAEILSIDRGFVRLHNLFPN